MEQFCFLKVMMFSEILSFVALDSLSCNSKRRFLFVGLSRLATDKIGSNGTHPTKPVSTLCLYPFFSLTATKMKQNELIGPL